MQIVVFQACFVTYFVSPVILQSREFVNADNLLRMALKGRKHFVSAKHIMEEFKVIKLQSVYF